MFPPPPVQGLGTIGGFKLQIEDRAGLGYDALNEATKAFMAKAVAGAGAGRAVLELSGQRAAALCRHRSHQGAPARCRRDRRVRDACRSIWARCTSTTSTSSVAPIRCACRPMRSFGPAPTTSASSRCARAAARWCRSPALLRVKHSAGPERAMRYNGFLSADINGGAARGFSSGEAQAAVERIAAETLPNGFELRMDGADLSGNPGGQLGAVGVPAGDPAGVPGAGGAV